MALQVGDVLAERDERGVRAAACEKLELAHLLEREVQTLSGGELQRLAIACAVVAEADVYLFDEISTFLDVRQRLVAAEVVRSLLEPAACSRDKAGSALLPPVANAASKCATHCGVART